MSKVEAQTVSERLYYSCLRLTDELFWEGEQEDIESNIRDMIMEASTLACLLQVVKTEYRLEQLEKQGDPYTDGSSGTIEWINFKEKEPELAGEFLAHLDGGVILKIFRDKNGSYYQYPSMDDIEASCITHWAEVNRPGIQK